MNATGFVVASLLLVVLIAVAFGAQQMEAQQATEFEKLMADRDEALSVAEEATNQRNYANDKLEPALAKVKTLEESLAAKDAEIAKVSADLAKEQQRAEGLQVSVDRLNGEKAQMQEQLVALDRNYVDLQEKYEQAIAANPQLIPVTGVAVEDNSLCLPVSADDLPRQLGAGLAVLLGMVVLGSGGYAVYRSDPNRKVMVKMSREQLREFTKYQRERAKNAS